MSDFLKRTAARTSSPGSALSSGIVSAVTPTRRVRA